MTAVRFFVLALLTFSVFISLAGCSGSSSTSTSDARQARLWAQENARLQKTITDLESQLDDAKKDVGKYKNECDKEKQELLAQCENEKQQLQKDIDETTSFLMEKLPTDMLKQIAELQKEMKR